MAQQGGRYFQSQGFEAVYSAPADLPSDQQAIQPDQLYNWVRSHVPKSAEAIFIGGNGFRAISVIKALEETQIARFCLQTKPLFGAPCVYPARERLLVTTVEFLSSICRVHRAGFLR